MGWEAKTKHAAYTVTPSIQVTAEPGQQEAGPAQQDAGNVGTAPWSDVALAVPDAPEPGKAVGQPVLVGGADLVDSTATLLAYVSPEQSGTQPRPREVLFATVTEEAEAKLLEALATSAPTQTVQVDKQLTERLPLDDQHDVYGSLVAAAKSVNKHLKDGEQPGKVESCLVKVKAAQHALEMAKADAADSGPDDQLMLQHYQTHLDGLAARINGDISAAYDQGGKVPMVTEYLHTKTVTIAEEQPVPVEGLLATTTRNASRLAPTIDSHTGLASWDGTSRTKADGKEYGIDLGDGYTAVYRPYGLNDPSTHEYTLRGQLEVHAPQGSGHGHDLVRKLGELNLVNRPMSHAEGEWAYLHANLVAQGLEKRSKVKAAMKAADSMESMELQEVFHARAHEAVGLDEPGLHKLAKQFQLEAAARCLPKKVRLLRDAVAGYTGHNSGDDLAASPGYDPTPNISGGWLTWGRFDVIGSTDAIAKAWEGKSFIHQVNGSNLTKMLTTGVLASTERRALMGVQAGLGMSEDSDKYTGGANSVFLRAKNTKAHLGGPVLVWDNPAVLLARADYYAYPADHFGAINPHHHNTGSSMTRDPYKIAEFAGNYKNEIMFRNGLDLFGAEAPSRIICSSSDERDKILTLLGDKGITTLGGKPVTHVVTTKGTP